MTSEKSTDEAGSRYNKGRKEVTSGTLWYQKMSADTV